MRKKCPPGVICFQNMTLVVLVFCVLLGIYFIVSKSSFTTPQKIIIQQPEQNDRKFGIFAQPSYSFSNLPNDILLNPYAPPRKQNPYFSQGGDVRGGIPINQNPTGYQQQSYNTVGMLAKVGGNKPVLLPLLGRPIHRNGDKWQYYTFSENNSFVKLPVSANGKNCTGDYGCKELYNNDTVYVDGYNDVFKVTIYENNSPQYIPVV
jgi:hypothetical protein